MKIFIIYFFIWLHVGVMAKQNQLRGKGKDKAKGEIERNGNENGGGIAINKMLLVKVMYDNKNGNNKKQKYNQQENLHNLQLEMQSKYALLGLINGQKVALSAHLTSGPDWIVSNSCKICISNSNSLDQKQKCNQSCPFKSIKCTKPICKKIENAKKQKQKSKNLPKSIKQFDVVNIAVKSSSIEQYYISQNLKDRKKDGKFNMEMCLVEKIESNEDKQHKKETEKQEQIQDEDQEESEDARQQKEQQQQEEQFQKEQQAQSKSLQKFVPSGRINLLKQNKNNLQLFSGNRMIMVKNNDKDITVYYEHNLKQDQSQQQQQNQETINIDSVPTKIYLKLYQQLKILKDSNDNFINFQFPLSSSLATSSSSSFSPLTLRTTHLNLDDKNLQKSSKSFLSLDANHTIIFSLSTDKLVLPKGIFQKVGQAISQIFQKEANLKEVKGENKEKGCKFTDSVMKCGFNIPQLRFIENITFSFMIPDKNKQNPSTLQIPLQSLLQKCSKTSCTFLLFPSPNPSIIFGDFLLNIFSLSISSLSASQYISLSPISNQYSHIFSQQPSPLLTSHHNFLYTFIYIIYRSIKFMLTIILYSSIFVLGLNCCYRWRQILQWARGIGARVRKGGLSNQDEDNEEDITGFRLKRRIQDVGRGIGKKIQKRIGKMTGRTKGYQPSLGIDLQEGDLIDQSSAQINYNQDNRNNKRQKVKKSYNYDDNLKGTGSGSASGSGSQDQVIENKSLKQNKQKNLKKQDKINEFEQFNHFRSQTNQKQSQQIKNSVIQSSSKQIGFQQKQQSLKQKGKSQQQKHFTQHSKHHEHDHGQQKFYEFQQTEFN